MNNAKDRRQHFHILITEHEASIARLEAEKEALRPLLGGENTQDTIQKLSDIDAQIDAVSAELAKLKIRVLNIEEI